MTSPLNPTPPPPLEFAHGTTTLSFLFKHGIIVAVDSRASIGTFVGSKTTQKVLPIDHHILGTMAGGAADCSYWIRRIRSEARVLDLENNNSDGIGDGNEIGGISVARASRLLSNALYQNRHLDLSVGTMIMGYDHGGKSDRPPSIYYVDNTGQRLRGEMFSVGSGSTFALGILDTERRYDMSEDEAISLGIKAIRHATFRDGYSGGYIGVYIITRDGWRKVFSEDLALSADFSSDIQ
uniref:Proteasome subunit beta n=1 Tax=Proboscia inermis TaxID=420281 RepID=A0A6T8NQD8_9STRA|mmetsp:Transcript_48665/g.49025  ORF Transcript_48665/g.49025 Transcript_48665/m.49025 type:complete len:238 (+) Transcript_48665:2-715(+)